MASQQKVFTSNRSNQNNMLFCTKPLKSTAQQPPPPHATLIRTPFSSFKFISGCFSGGFLLFSTILHGPSDYEIGQKKSGAEL